MSEPITVSLSRPVASVKVLDGYSVSAVGRQAECPSDSSQPSSPDAEAQKALFSQACQALHSAAAKLNELYDKLFMEHREEIAKLSVEIARKILMQKVNEGDYGIESIIKEALKNAPARSEVTVHLNPEDHAQCRKALQQEQEQQGGGFAGIQFVSDWSIGRAECVIETPKGIVKSLIDENLERISQALTKAD